MKKFDTLVTLDFETYWSQDYTLSKMTTEAYIRDPRFKAHMVGLKVNDGPAFVVPHENIQAHLNTFDWKRTAVLMHHAHFDGLILSHHYGIKPAFFFDTLSMARALHGTQVGNSLAKLADHYGIGAKGKELIDSKGVRDFDPAMYKAIAGYCANDVELTYKLFMKMRAGYPKLELEIIDCVVKMFTRPAVELDGPTLHNYVVEEQSRKAQLMETLGSEYGITQDMLMSNQQFAALLESLGVEVPMKISPTTNKPTFALAKSDRGMTDLLDHDNQLVADIAAARLGVKSTINETRAIRLLEMGQRGKAPIYLNYSGAVQTHRLSGGDKVNWQNLPRGGTLRRAIKAPRGTSLVACDSSNIELRVNMTLAGQMDAVAALRAGADLYCDFASGYYGRTITKADKMERMLGKVALLGLGYGMGADKFKATARLMGKLQLDDAEAERTVRFYRGMYKAVPRWWYAWNDVIPTLASGRIAAMHDAVVIRGGMIHFPTGMPLQYPDLRQDANGEWSIKTRNVRTRVYGPKLVENITQAIARNIVMEQTLVIARKYPVVMSVHDEVVFLCREGEEAEAMDFAVRAMSTSPDWLPSIPLAAEASHGRTYGDCK